MKLKLNNSCFKNQSRCWTMNETPTMTEDLFPADNSDAYDIVRNSDFMVRVLFISILQSTNCNCVHLVSN